MAITTLDGVIAGFQPPQSIVKSVSGTLVAGRPFTPLYTAGIPSAATAYAGGLNGVALTSLAGQIPFSGTNNYLGRFQGAVTQAGTLMLCDRLWHNSIVVTTTTAQAITTPAWPARDRTGTINGVDVYIGLEISGTVGTGTATPSIVYTNSAGSGSKAGAMLVPYVASSLTGTFYPFTLQSGDVGVKSVESVTLGVSMTSGTAGLVAYRVLAQLEIPIGGMATAIDALTGGMTKMYDNTVPFLVFIPSTTTTSNITAQMICTQG